MSRILRRPMFRGGPVNSEGTGITSGLDQNYATGGRVGFKEGEGSFDDDTFDYLKDTGLGRFIPKFNEYLFKEPLAAAYNLVGVPLNKITEFVTGYNPGFSGERIFNLDMKGRRPDTAEFFGMDTSAKPGFTYIEEKKRNKDLANVEKQKLPIELKEEVTPKYNLPTLEQDIDSYNKLLLDRAGPDKDEYTRQKYLTLAKFGLNLLKPTPAGVKPSLFTSLASAAEKPLEEYGNISMQESKEDRALKQLATQMAFQKHMPGNIAKGIQDLMASNPKMTVEEATSIITTGKNLATIQKEQRLALDETRKRLELNPNLKGLAEKDPASLNLLAKLVEKGNIDDTQIKGDFNKYNKYVENSYYTNVPNPLTGLKEVARYYNGQFHFRGEPGFFIKQTGI